MRVFEVTGAAILVVIGSYLTVYALAFAAGRGWHRGKAGVPQIVHHEGEQKMVLTTHGSGEKNDGE